MIYKHHEFVRAKHQFSFFGQEKQRKQIASKRVNEQILNIHEKTFHGEFDPGSGRTLAACLTHASRTEFLKWISSE